MNRETIIEAMTREELKAAIAAAIKDATSIGGAPNKPCVIGHFSAAAAALAAIEAAGVRLVPAKCTDDMAGYAGARAEARGDIRMLPGEYRAAWEAMLAASPYAPPGG